MHFKTRAQARQHLLAYSAHVRQCLQVVKTQYWDMAIHSYVSTWTITFNPNKTIICWNTLNPAKRTICWNTLDPAKRTSSP